MERQTEAQTVKTGNECLYDLNATVGAVLAQSERLL